MKTLLELDGVAARYGPVQALHDVSLVVRGRGVGPRRERRGEDDDASRDLGHRLTIRRDRARRQAGQGRAEAAARAGIAHVPEGRGTFVDLTVTENLLGAYQSQPLGEKADLRRIAEYFPWMTERGSQRAGTLSGGEQQMLALGRALMSRLAAASSTSPRSASRR